MEATRVAASQPQLLRRPNLSNPIKLPTDVAALKIKPFISAVIFKPKVEISPKPTAVPLEKPLQDPPPLPPLPLVSPYSLQYPAGYLGAAPDHRAAAAVGGDGGLDAMWYLKSILSSKVYDVAVESPLHFAPKLSEKLGFNVWLKREDLQPVSPFFTHFHDIQQFMASFVIAK